VILNFGPGISKSQITKQLLSVSNYQQNDSTVKDFFISIWHNTRHETRSYRLTEVGFSVFNKCKVVSYTVEVAESVRFTNRIILQLDKFITAPYYLQKRQVIVFDQNTAIQLILFAGDLEKYAQSRQDSENYD
jgi:hypothetical protein